MRALLPTGRPDELVGFDEVPEPEPTGNQAVVAVSAFGLNRGELFLVQSGRPGLRPGKDIAGTIVATAADGSGPAVGTQVVAHPSLGGWAERAAVDTTALTPLPDSVTVETAAALPLAGLTALRLLRAAGATAGRRVLLTGASGGVGHYVTELAAAGGADVTVVTATAERAERLLQLGATAAVRDVDDAEGPFDVVLESVGGEVGPRALAKVGKRGLFVWFGQASRTPATFDFFALFRGPESGTIRHFHYADHDGPDGADLAALVRLVDTGRLHPEVDVVTDWKDTASVLARLRDRDIRGKAVLRVES